MTNTVIAIKKSATPSAVPPSLANGELALNYADGKLFYKAANGTITAITSGSPSFGTINANNTLIVAGVVNDVLGIVPGTNIEITPDAINNRLTITGNQKAVYDTANAAFNQANLSGASVNVGSTPPTSPTQGNLWWNSNIGRLLIYYTDVDTNQWVETSSASSIGSSGGDPSSAYNTANAAFNTANAAYTSANNVGPQIAPTYNTANAAYNHANSGYTTANDAYSHANTKFSSSGGTITGAVEINADLTVRGNTHFIDQQTLLVGDSLIYLAANNYSSDVVDIGFIANYVNTTSVNVHTGLFRSSGTKEYYLFQGYDKEPLNNYIDPTGNNITMAVLNSTIRTSNLILGGANSINWIRSNYDTTNAAFGKANTALQNTSGTFAGSLTATGTITANSYVYVTSEGAGNEGGEIQISGAASYTSWSIDSYQNNYRVFARTGTTLSNVNFFHANASGSVRMGVNKTDPLYTLDVNGGLYATSLGVGTGPSGTTGEIRATNNITAYYSDGRLKTIISTIPSPLEKINQLSGVIYINNETASLYGYNDKSEQVGVIAQQVEKVLPQIVKPAPFDIELRDGVEVSKSGENYKTVQYDKLVPLLIEAIKELKTEIDELRKTLNGT